MKAHFHLFVCAACAYLLFTGAVSATNTIDVMSFNLRYASASDGANNWTNSTQSPERRQVVLRVILNHAPDVVGFQEGEDIQLDYLEDNLPGFAFDRRKPSGGGGNENAAMAWNTNSLELIDRGVFSLGPAPGGAYWNNIPGTNFDPYIFFPDMGLNFPRICLWGKFLWKGSGQEFLFYTTHFDFNDTPQVRSASLMVDDARSRNDRMPVSPLAIIVGDFNSSHLNNSWKLFTGTVSTNGITGDFTDSWFSVYGNWNNSGTLHGFNGGVRPESERIDWILHRGGFTAVTAQIIYDAALATNLNNGTTRTQYPSDHYPVKARLALPPRAADHDRDGLPDTRELSHTNSLAVDADSDNDLLLDGLEDLNGNGSIDGGETAPNVFSTAQNPTDIRNYQMNGVRDVSSSLLAINGLELWAAFDGRYLYVATQDAGEGSDHYILISTNPAHAVNAPWAKSGQVGQWFAFLADENDGSFRGWFDAGGNIITNVFTARAATYYQNGGRLEGVIDLGALISPGFTSPIYLAAAPYGTADGGSLVSVAQVPAGNGDADLLGVSEYVILNPGDTDHDGVNDTADPDRDGDGLPDAWEIAYGLLGDGDDDPDVDHAENQHEFFSCTNPTSSASEFGLHQMEANTFSWSVPMGKTSSVWRLVGPSFNTSGSWSLVTTMINNVSFPVSVTNITLLPADHYFLLKQSP